MISATSEQPSYCTSFSNGTHQAFSDTTPDKGGRASGFRPHELLEAALACCVNMTVRMYAENHAVPLDSVTTRVTLERGPDHSVFRYEAEFHGDRLTPDQRSKLLEIAAACPVRRTLSKAIRFEAAAAR